MGFFLHGCLALKSTEELREETHAMVYITQGGFNYNDVMGMTRADRDWHIARLAQQKGEERKEMDAMKHKRGKK